MIRRLQEQVLYCLERIPETRNSDVRLTNAIWWVYYRQKLILNDRGEPMVRLKDLYFLPREDNVKRIRAKIQNDEKRPRFLPTDWLVAKQRKINEEVWWRYIKPEPEF